MDASEEQSNDYGYKEPQTLRAFVGRCVKRWNPEGILIDRVATREVAERGENYPDHPEWKFQELHQSRLR